MFIVVTLLIIGGVIGFIYLLQGAPYVASTDESLEQMYQLIKRRPAHRLLDLGAGKGHVLIFFAEKGYHIDGIELNPLLVWKARRNIKRAGLSDRATVKWGNLWKYDVSKYDLITLYGVTHIMARLEGKLTLELQPGSRIVSNYFVFPNLKPVKELQRAKLYKI